MNRHSAILWLTAIKYEGSDIGSDTEFDFTAGGQKTHIDSDIKHGRLRLFSKPLFMQAIQSAEAKLTVTVKVREEREPVPDTGQGSREYVIDSGSGRSRLDPIIVPVQENLGMFGRAGTATFTFELESELFSYDEKGIHYVVAANNGWLRVRAEDGGSKEFSLPALLKVAVTGVVKDREYFTVLEGPLTGRKGSVSLRNSASRLSATSMKRDPAVQMLYHCASLRLEVPGLGDFSVVKPRRNPFPVGKTFKIEIPDHPHAGGRRYSANSTFATSWFRIVDPVVTDRYLHMGRISNGCSTVQDTERWDALYRFLINRRADQRHVGSIKIVGD